MYLKNSEIEVRMTWLYFGHSQQSNPISSCSKINQMK